jgi:2-keto-4-pentenoate hydratase
MMTESSRKASDMLIDHWQKGTTLPALPEDLRPAGISAGYEIQQHILRLTKNPLFGWKIAATSEAGQRHINVDRPLAGRILDERVTKSGDAVVSLGPNRMRVGHTDGCRGD